jgi:Uma2 family endonuclease
MTAPAEKLARLATVHDLLAIPEEDRHHELIDGAIVEKGAASGEHGQAQLTALTSFQFWTRACQTDAAP